MADLREVHQRSLRGFQVAMQEANMHYQHAEINNDIDGMAAAAQQMAGLRASMNELNSMARDAYAAQPTNPSRYGLSEEERYVARNSYTDPTGRMTEDDKERVYMEQKAKHRHMVATGAYSVDQGSVRR
ncbi:hypothetical protein [Bradyrhizobium genosp. A]|uniref:hypothetical protein n=1 Tax=Bradyrhizobium genosp. A TaxID=83626 RepID=UPI003CF67B8E